MAWEGIVWLDEDRGAGPADGAGPDGGEPRVARAARYGFRWLLLLLAVAGLSGVVIGTLTPAGIDRLGRALFGGACAVDVFGPCVPVDWLSVGAGIAYLVCTSASLGLAALGPLDPAIPEGRLAAWADGAVVALGWSFYLALFFLATVALVSLSDAVVGVVPWTVLLALASLPLSLPSLAALRRRRVD